MKREWVTVQISDIGKVVTGKTPPTADSKNYGGKLPFITPSDMIDQKFLYLTERTISDKGSQYVKNLLLPPKTVLVSCIGSVGKVGLTKVESVTNQQINSIIVKNGIDPDYIFYNLCSRKEELQRLATSGSVQPILNKSHFSQLKIVLPPLLEQRAIAHILGTLDDKIELNRKMNETFEAMARAIFKSWFIDFDPVHAKAQGRDPKLPKEIADLFPDNFQDSELGKIPKGWRVVSLPETIEINPVRSLPKGTEATYLDMANVPNNSARVNKVIKRPFGSGAKFINGDTLLARITPCLENGKTAFVDFLEHDQVGCGSTEFIVLRPKAPLPPVFAYFLARDPEFRAFAIFNMSGTSGRQRVPSDCFNSYKLVMPRDSIASAFGEFASVIMQKLKANDEQTHTLAIIRDILLPKLLSGEIRVKDMENMI